MSRLVLAEFDWIPRNSKGGVICVSEVFGFRAFHVFGIILPLLISGPVLRTWSA